ncbi:MAG: ABC transporter C-terminal domain-containing protein, partial [Truepera sp.]|nr:ABC transporter C-terminal domain-containing protein [Truepera sp.]
VGGGPSPLRGGGGPPTPPRAPPGPPPPPRRGGGRPGPVTRTRTGPSRWRLERDLEALEQRITGLEARLGELNRTLAQPDLLGPDQIAELGREYTGVEEALLEAMAHWEATTTALGEAGC